VYEALLSAGGFIGEDFSTVGVSTTTIVLGCFSLGKVDGNNYVYDNIKYRLFAKNIGLIKYIDRDSNQWELIKYHINQ
jgi:hypothetical protein